MYNTQKQNRRPDSNIEKSMTNLFWLNRIIGLMFFEFPVGRPWPKLSVFYCLGLFSGYGYLWIHTTKLTKKENNLANEAVRLAVIEFFKMFSVTIAAICIILQHLNNKKLKKIRENIRTVDLTLQIFGLDAESADYRESRQIVTIWSSMKALHITANVLASAIYYEKPYKGLIRVMVFELPIIWNCFIMVNFTVMICIIGIRFKKINLLLRNLLLPSKIMRTVKTQFLNLNKNKNEDSDIAKNFRKKKNMIEFIIIISRRLHFDLCRISREINYAYNMQIVLHMLMSLLYITLLAQSIYITFLMQNITYTAQMLLYFSTLTSMIFTIFSITYMIYITVDVVTEAQKTCGIAHRIEVPDSQSKIYDKIDQLSMQIKQHPLYFTGFGLFILDFSYLRRMLGSSLTYLMILIQYHKEVSNIITKNS